MDHTLFIPAVADQDDIEQEELRGFSRTIAEIEWLLTILVLLYLKLPGAFVSDEFPVLTSLSFYVIVIITFHYIVPQYRNTRWKLAIETWCMISFITFVLWHTGKMESPLVSLYFLVIITAAITLGKSITLLEVGLISACCLLLSFSPSTRAHVTLSHITGPLLNLFPFWFAAFLVTMLSRETGLARKKIQHLSQTDHLTGLWNMRTFSRLLEAEHIRSSRYKHPFSLLMVDADNLKPVNDTYGHEAGSNMIKHLAKMLKAHLRESDSIARFGGDEFVVLLPETDADIALLVAERMRTSIEKNHFKNSEKSIPVTVSIGIAVFPHHGDEPDTVMKKADESLYRSKRNGKNRSTLYSIQ